MNNSESNKKSPNHTFKKNGKYTVTLTVTDSHNLTSTVTKDVIVASVSAIDPPVENSAPVANFSYEDTDEGLVTFSNNSSDPDNDKLIILKATKNLQITLLRKTVSILLLLR